MKIRTLLFASYRDIVGTDELLLDLPSDAAVRDLVAHLRESGEGWDAIPASPAVAVNMTYAPLSAALRDGDEVALIPPVAGG